MVVRPFFVGAAPDPGLQRRRENHNGPDWHANGTCNWVCSSLLRKNSFDSEDESGQANDRDHHPPGRSAYAIWAGSNSSSEPFTAEHSTTGQSHLAGGRGPPNGGARSVRIELPRHPNSNMNWSACRRTTTSSVRCNPAPLQAFTEAAQIRLQLFAQNRPLRFQPHSWSFWFFWLTAIFVSCTLFCPSQSDL